MVKDAHCFRCDLSSNRVNHILVRALSSIIIQIKKISITYNSYKTLNEHISIKKHKQWSKLYNHTWFKKNYLNEWIGFALGYFILLLLISLILYYENMIWKLQAQMWWIFFKV